jgi:hypothetical protein
MFYRVLEHPNPKIKLAYEILAKITFLWMLLNYKCYWRQFWFDWLIFDADQ